MTDNCGIYKITNIVTGDFYIGSAVNLRKRFSQHRSTLTANCHRNIHLQRSWNKYGADSFTFEIVLSCEKEQLLEREQIHMDLLKPTFNILRIAGSPLGVKRTGESRRRMSESHKGHSHTEETKHNMSLAHSGVSNLSAVGNTYNLGKHRTEETCKKIGLAAVGNQIWTGRHHTEESNRKNSLAHLGRAVSDETKRKIGDASRSMWARRKAEAL